MNKLKKSPNHGVHDAKECITANKTILSRKLYGDRSNVRL